MKIRKVNLNTNEITADEGKKLTDGIGFYSKVFLSNLDNIDNYTEISESEIKEEEDELEN